MNCLHSAYWRVIVLQESTINNASHLPAFFMNWAQKHVEDMHSFPRDSSRLKAAFWSAAASRPSSLLCVVHQCKGTWLLQEAFSPSGRVLIWDWFYLISCWISLIHWVFLFCVPDLFLLLRQIWRVHLGWQLLWNETWISTSLFPEIEATKFPKTSCAYGITQTEHISPLQTTTQTS